MKLLPVALNVEQKHCLVVGGGPVALRKAQALLECGALVAIISPSLCPDFRPLRDQIDYDPREFQGNDCTGFHLVFACTDSRHVNAAIADAARQLGILCSVADDPRASDLHSAATVRRGDICVGITTGGSSPALARHLKHRVDEAVGAEYEALLEMLEAWRSSLVQIIEEQSERADIWRAILSSEVLDLLKEGKRAEAERLVDAIVSGHVESA